MPRHGPPASIRLRLLVILLVSGCASGPEAVAPPMATPLWCPTPLQWTEGQPRPVRLVLNNQTDIALSVYLDECTGKVLLGFIGPGETARLRLPGKLIPFDGALQLDLNDRDAQTPFGSYAVPVLMDWTLTLTIDANTTRVERTYATGAAAAKPPDGIRGFQTSPGEEISYASTWAEGTDAVLTWVCVREEPQLSFSPVVTEAETMAVTTLFENPGQETGAFWEVAKGRTKNLLAPDTLVFELTAQALVAETLTIILDPGSSEERYRFRMDGLSEALGSLPCFHPTGAGRPTR